MPRAYRPSISTGRCATTRLMQTIARANRVFPEKDNGLIVDYIGVFRDLEAGARHLRRRERRGGVDSPIQDNAALVAALGRCRRTRSSDLCAATTSTLTSCATPRVSRFIALRDAAVEALLIDEEIGPSSSPPPAAPEAFKAILPDPAAAAYQPTVAVIRVLAERIDDCRAAPGPTSSGRRCRRRPARPSVGAEEYVIRAAAEGIEPDPLIDLSQIDFDALAARFAGRKRAETDRLAVAAEGAGGRCGSRNPTRFDLVERIEELIAEYNAGSLNIDEYLRRLIALSRDLSNEEQRAVIEDMTEEELAIFDLLTKPDPVLDDAERESVKASAKRLLAHLHDKLVLDWRRRRATAACAPTIRDVLDAGPSRGSVPAGALRCQGPGSLRPRPDCLRRRRYQRLRRARWYGLAECEKRSRSLCPGRGHHRGPASSSGFGLTPSSPRLLPPSLAFRVAQPSDGRRDH